ncbi:hypothetical protein XENTR_v10009807 [Xenopus tropicalis]|uniref:Uncharacterized LOC100491437 n=1 Tax=Xenopus tropicalis TaxID=8364 RepID=A0A6I8QVY9_XENTR|nr:uncharacterized protein LOC100491437 isoform X1 [Xenopus tropicalis]KAE8619478.1 hypothetical protein XENTR_v10009807 [Xenopus tropicalis]|eukprot:XP_004912571.1 PREDICTED: uncharacterized protein LOC100491437 isoform X1 [Xenopus tropicalis]
MRPLLLLSLVLSLPLGILSCSFCKGKALRCYSCVASSEEECYKQGSHVCPQYAEVCSTITAPNSVIKSCSYKSFCDHARQSGNGASVECCFSDDCNGPAKGNTAGLKNSASCAALPPLFLTAALLTLRAL